MASGGVGGWRVDNALVSAYCAVEHAALDPMRAPDRARRTIAQMKHNLDGKTFRSAANTPNGEVGAETLFRYHQSGSTVSADYSGGAIVTGHLLAVMDDHGRLDMRYHHLNDQGELMAGQCVSTPERLPDGRLRFHETWLWLTGDQSSGQSTIEEVAG